MSLVVLTGTLAVVSDEIDWLIHPELRAEPLGEPATWGEIEASIRAYAPGDKVTQLFRGEGSYFNYRALMFDVSGKGYYLYIDPTTAEVTGTTSTLTVQRFLRDLHRYLFMPSIIGLPLVTTMAVVLLISLYTGLKTTRNWGTVATRVRLNKGARVAIGDFHKAAGLWGSWFIALIVITSFWYFSELSAAVGGKSFEPGRPGVSLERAESFGRVAEDADSGQLVAAAEAAMPGFHATEILYAASARQSTTVLGRMQDPLVRRRANRVFLDPVDASVIHAQRSTEIDWVAYLNELADPLHFGSFGSLTTKLIWFVFGLAMFAMTLTGVYLTWKRVKTATPTAYQFANLPIFLIATLFAIPYVDRYISLGVSEHEVALGSQTVEDLSLAAFLGVDSAGTPDGSVRFVVATESGRLQLAPSSFRLDEADAVEMRPRLQSQTMGLTATAGQEELLTAAELSLDLRFADGQSLTASWSLEQLASFTPIDRLEQRASLARQEFSSALRAAPPLSAKASATPLLTTVQ